MSSNKRAGEKLDRKKFKVTTDPGQEIISDHFLKSATEMNPHGFIDCLIYATYITSISPFYK